jgi:hypothetical protein
MTLLAACQFFVEKPSSNALMVIGYARRMAIRKYRLLASGLFKSAVNICKSALSRCVFYGRAA